MPESIRCEFTLASPKKHSIRFMNHDETAMLRDVYIPNDTLKALGYVPGDRLVVTLSVE